MTQLITKVCKNCGASYVYRHSKIFNTDKYCDPCLELLYYVNQGEKTISVRREEKHGEK